MSSSRLQSRPVERVWGVSALPSWAAEGERQNAPIGEIWFEEDSDREAELLVKLLFTSERLSIQVHPDDAAARAIGLPRGKEEAWLVLDAEPGAVIGLGLRESTSKQTLKAAARDGGIERLIDWRPVRTGDFFYCPAGTVHAIGAGLSLVEIQQNLDLTYRLYDYGRPRELHLDEGIAAALPAPWRTPYSPVELAPGRTILTAGAAFVVERWTLAGAARIRSADGQLLLIPLAAQGELDGRALTAGSVWRIEGEALLSNEAATDILVAYPGGQIRPDALAET